MEYVQLDATGITASRIGFGCAGLGNEYGGLTDAAATDVVSFAIDNGITYFDTSAYYGRGLSEVRLGTALAGRRHDVIVATKGGRFDAPLETGFDFSYEGIIGTCESSLKRLQTDYIDVYQLHDIEFGNKTEVFEEAMRAMTDLKSSGKVRAIGVTGYPLPLLVDAVETFDLDAVLSYCRYNLMDRSLQDSLIPVAKERSTSVINASILHMGMLSDRGPQDWHPAPDNVKAVARTAISHCETIGVSISDVAIQFALANKDIDVTLLGSNKIDTVARSLAAAAKPVDDEVVAGIEQVIGVENLGIVWRSGRSEHWEKHAQA